MNSQNLYEAAFYLSDVKQSVDCCQEILRDIRNLREDGWNESAFEAFQRKIDSVSAGIEELQNQASDLTYAAQVRAEIAAEAEQAAGENG